MTLDSVCPSADVLRRSLDPDGSMTESDRRRIEDHVNRCQKGCKQAIHALLRDDTQACQSIGAQESGPEAGQDVAGSHPGSFGVDATIAGKNAAPDPTAARWDDREVAPPRGALDAAARYEVGGEIARGGMGAIVRAVDQDIRREVAVKFLLNPADQNLKARFIEEAQITGQLEHPNIVPIHQLGIDEDGRCFFSMKMVKGHSLADILHQQGETPASGSGHTLGRLLNIFVSICNAMAYAHARDVIHRDLKPANVMVGDFGEVYVMDWGLAKVMNNDGPQSGAPGASTLRRRSEPAQDRTQAGNLAEVPAGDKVTTSRQAVGELTQAGSIIGTPSYMPPEQARGGQVDHRSDIYALGAILYAIMTLTPPVGREGDMLTTLSRVAEGKIEPPQKRSPQRAQAGWIPAELSAIALKALARNPADRYQTVSALRRDVELFLEGRSVSAKQDSFREMAWKLVKRNKGASITAAAALLLLTAIAGGFLKLNYDARVLAELERNKAKDAYQAYQDQVKDSVPAFLGAARMFLNERQFDLALAQASLAVKSAPEHAEARLLKGKLLIARKRFNEAAVELKEYQKLKGKDAGAPTLAEMCRKAGLDDTGALLAFAEVFTQQGEHALADGVLSSAGATAVDARQRLLAMYRQRIEAAWPGKGPNLTMSEEGRFFLVGLENVKDLTPLQGMPLTSLQATKCAEVRDLTPLKGMPLTHLYLEICPHIRDLTPLQGMALTSLTLWDCAEVRDLTPLQGMPLAHLHLYNCPHVRDLESLKGMPLTFLSLGLFTEVRDLTPLKGMRLTTLHLHHCSEVRDITLLKSMPLNLLDLGNTKVGDVAPLKGMPLTVLNLLNCPVRDLTPLAGMQLNHLVISGHQLELRDLKLLKEMPLTHLGLISTEVQDLAVLKGRPLKELDLNASSNLGDLAPLQGMTLTSLALAACPQVKDLTPLKDMPLKGLLIFNSGVTDLKPLQGLQLEQILFTPKNITQGLDVLRTMKSLKTIGLDYLQVWPPAEFWARYDRGEFKK